MSKVINMLSEAEDWRLTEPFNKGWSHKVIVYNGTVKLDHR